MIIHGTGLIKPLGLLTASVLASTGASLTRKTITAVTVTSVNSDFIRTEVETTSPD